MRLCFALLYSWGEGVPQGPTLGLLEHVREMEPDPGG